VGRQLDQFAAPRRLLVQWVPHGYGYRSMNVPFCLWMLNRAKLHGDHIGVMFHEPFFAFTRQSWKQNAAAVVHRLMTIMLLQAARQVWVSTPAWERMLRPYTLGRKVPFAWLPVPSNIAAADDPAGISAVRAQYAPPGGSLVGHFGTYGPSIKETLMAVLPALLAGEKNLAMLLIGRGSEALREELARQHPDMAARLQALSGLEAEDVARHISACDVMLQPYPDGISARRTSAMASLANSRPVVTTAGRFTEPLWAASGAVVLTPDGDAAAMMVAAKRLLNDAAERQRLGDAARALYQSRFDVRDIVAQLRGAEPLSQTVSLLNQPATTEH
jgi:glycosyltransferase involved in cell wall biosynthesis